MTLSLQLRFVACKWRAQQKTIEVLQTKNEYVLAAASRAKRPFILSNSRCSSVFVCWWSSLHSRTGLFSSIRSRSRTVQCAVRSALFSIAKRKDARLITSDQQSMRCSTFLCAGKRALSSDALILRLSLSLSLSNKDKDLSLLGHWMKKSVHRTSSRSSSSLTHFDRLLDQTELLRKEKTCQWLEDDDRTDDKHSLHRHKRQRQWHNENIDWKTTRTKTKETSLEEGALRAEANTREKFH